MQMMTRENWIGELPARVQAEIAERMTMLHIPAGESFRRAGEIGSAVYHVHAGYLKLHGLHPDGNRVLIVIYRPGNCFGESPLVARRPHNHSTVAMTDCKVRSLSEKDFWEIYAAHPAVPDALCRKFANVMTRQFASRELRVAHRLRDRLVTALRVLAQECGEAMADGSILIPLPLSQSDFAEYLEVTRQAVQREMGAMKAADIVDQHRDFWVIKRPELLDRRLAA